MFGLPINSLLLSSFSVDSELNLVSVQSELSTAKGTIGMMLIEVKTSLEQDDYRCQQGNPSSVRVIFQCFQTDPNHCGKVLV